MLVKLKVSLSPNWNENIIKSKEITPEPSGVRPAKEKSILLRKNSRTTLSGSIHPNNSPSSVPRRVPKNKINTIFTMIKRRNKVKKALKLRQKKNYIAKSVAKFFRNGTNYYDCMRNSFFCM